MACGRGPAQEPRANEGREAYGSPFSEQSRLLVTWYDKPGWRGRWFFVWNGPGMVGLEVQRVL